MRLSEIYDIIKHINTDELQVYSNSEREIVNLNSFKELITFIKHHNLDFYEEEINSLEASVIFSTSQNKLFVANSDTRSHIINEASTIVNSIKSLQIVLSRLIPASSENDFLIKFPQPNEFKTLLEDMAEIEKQLNILLSDDSIKASINIHNWEYGSFWVNIGIGTTVAVSLLGSVTWASAYISTHIQEYKQNELYLERMEMGNEVLRDLKEKNEIYLNTLLDSEITHINEIYFPDLQSNERDKKLKNTIQLFSNLILRGAEFQPSLIAPKEMKESFPNFKSLDGIQSQIKQITHKKDK